MRGSDQGKSALHAVSLEAWGTPGERRGVCMRVTPKVPSEPVPALQNRLRGEAVTPGHLGMSGGGRLSGRKGAPQ